MSTENMEKISPIVDNFEENEEPETAGKRHRASSENERLNQEKLTPGASESNLKSQSLTQLALPSLDDADTLSTGSDVDITLPYSASDSLSLSRHLEDSALSTRSALACEMCANYEIRLQQIQESERNLKQQMASTQHLADRYHTELSAERLYRKELETKMSQLSSQTKEQQDQVTDSLGQVESALKEAAEIFGDRLDSVKYDFDALKKDRMQLEGKMNKIQERYDALLGKNSELSNSMQNEAISLPQTVDELQLLCLQLREQLIETKAANEHLNESMQLQEAAVKEQVSAEQEERQKLEENLMEEVNALRTELGLAQSQISQGVEEKKRADDLENRLTEFQTTIGDLETKMASLQGEKGEIEFQHTELKKRSKTLQHELDNSETVQRDFVKLSQSLQIELEKIRQAEQEVRWQYQEDVYVCNACKEAFTKSRLKLHCRHCGKIFCDNCLPKSVPSGPQRRPARVCQVCYTLLVRDTAPYFSESVPNSM